MTQKKVTDEHPETLWWPSKLCVFPDSRCIARNTPKLIFCWDARKRQQNLHIRLTLFRKISPFLIYYLFPVSLAGAPSPHAWWLDPRLKIPIINLHHDKLRKCCASLSPSPLSYRPPFSPSSPSSPALSFIPHKHMRYGAVLMRTEWTDPRPRRHRGPPPQIHRFYQFSSSKGPNAESQTLQCFVLLPPRRFPKSSHYALFCGYIAEMLMFSLFFFSFFTLEILQMPFSKESVVKLLTIPRRVLRLHHGSQCWYSIWCSFSAWCVRSFIHPFFFLCSLTCSWPQWNPRQKRRVQACSHKKKSLNCPIKA